MSTRLFDEPLHPYTQGLIGSIPVLGEIKERLDVIPGSVPNLVNLPPGCRFAPRCQARFKYGLTICAEVKPELEEVKPGPFCALLVISKRARDMSLRLRLARRSPYWSIRQCRMHHTTEP